MSNFFERDYIDNIFDVIKDYIDKTELEEVNVSSNSKTNTVCISGFKGGYEYTTTLKREQGYRVAGKENSYHLKKCLKNDSDIHFSQNIAREVTRTQIRELLNDGYRQREVAEMLGVSQSLVSKYSRGKI